MTLFPVTTDADLVVLSAATVAAFPPTSYALITNWELKPPATFDFDLFAAGTVTLTNATLYGATLHTGIIADDVIEAVDTSAETLTLTAHGLLTGDGPVRFTTSDTLPGGITAGTDYWIIRADANKVSIATSFANALAGTKVGLSAGALGTNTLVDTSSTKLVRWHAHGLIGTGTISLSLRLGASVRCAHDTRRFAYAMSATFSDTIAVTATVTPVLP